MLVSFDIKFIRRDQKQRSREWRGLTSQSDVFLVEPDKLDINRQLHGFLFIMHHYKILRQKQHRRSDRKANAFLSELADVVYAL